LATIAFWTHLISMPNSEVKRNSADGSVGLPHVRVGHRQALNLRSPLERAGFFASIEF
jgi:hypothetical protein